MKDPQIKLIECPRDAMQGLKEFVPTKKKVQYLNSLLKVGFDTLDCGSFVSPKYIPQMKDTALVLDQLDENSPTKLLTIVANQRGANDACHHPRVDILGYPFSISETFQKRNTNSSIHDSLLLVETILGLCEKNKKDLVVYLSMGFGNPYGEEWNPEIVSQWYDKLVNMGIKTISLSDTIGVSNSESIGAVFNALDRKMDVEIGVHLHTRPHEWREKIESCLEAGCQRFDGAFLGFGGCPMAADDLTGNMPTEKMIMLFEEKGLETGLNKNEIIKAQQEASIIFA